MGNKRNIVKSAGVYAGIIVLIYSIIIFYQSLNLGYYTPLGPGPGFFPIWLSGLLIVLSLFYIIDSIKNEVMSITKILPKGKALQGVLSCVGGLILFCLTVPYTGFMISNSIMLLVMLVRDYKWYKALLASVAASFLLLFLFQMVLKVSLPVNDYGW